MKSTLLGLSLLMVASTAFAHAKWTNPVPRDNGIIGNDGNKVSPCGNLATKPATATNTYTPGQSVTLNFEETIDHPGRYYVQFSSANDLGFDSNRLIEVADVQGGVLPHLYTTTITMPTTLCENCTMQLIQSMEENPAAPSYYYSCFDMNIRAAVAGTTPAPTPTPTPTPGTVATQSTGGTTSSDAPTAKMAGCGSSGAKAMILPLDHPLEQHAALASFLTLLLPLATFLGLRRRRK